MDQQDNGSVGHNRNMHGDVIGARLERDTKNRYRIVCIGIFKHFVTLLAH